MASSNCWSALWSVFTRRVSPRRPKDELGGSATSAQASAHTHVGSQRWCLESNVLTSYFTPSLRSSIFELTIDTQSGLGRTSLHESELRHDVRRSSDVVALRARSLSEVHSHSSCGSVIINTHNTNTIIQRGHVAHCLFRGHGGYHGRKSGKLLVQRDFRCRGAENRSGLWGDCSSYLMLLVMVLVLDMLSRYARGLVWVICKW